MAHSSSDAEAVLLDREAVEAVDKSDLLTDVLAIPEHLRDAVWKAQSARLEDWDSPGGLVVAGMGGSAIGCELARAALGDTASRPILDARASGLPPWRTTLRSMDEPRPTWTPSASTTRLPTCAPSATWAPPPTTAGGITRPSIVAESATAR